VVVPRARRQQPLLRALLPLHTSDAAAVGVVRWQAIRSVRWWPCMATAKVSVMAAGSLNTVKLPAPARQYLDTPPCRRRSILQTLPPPYPRRLATRPLCCRPARPQALLPGPRPRRHLHSNRCVHQRARDRCTTLNSSGWHRPHRVRARRSRAICCGAAIRTSSGIPRVCGTPFLRLPPPPSRQRRTPCRAAVVTGIPRRHMLVYSAFRALVLHHPLWLVIHVPTSSVFSSLL